MTERPQPQQIQVHTTTHRFETGVNPQQRYEGGFVPQQRYEGGVGPQQRYEGGASLYPEKSPSTSQVVAVIAGLPVGGILLALAGLTLLGTLTGLALTTPLFILFSPVLVPATIVIGLAVAGFLTSGACGLTALSSFSWVMNYIRQTQGTVPEQFESAKNRMADVAGYVGQKTKEVGQDIQTRAQDARAQDAKLQEARAQDAKRTTGTTGVIEREVKV